ncbi:MAG: M24 family metallopeptidase [Candidatus Aminicenantes bacterium]
MTAKFKILFLAFVFIFTNETAVFSEEIKVPSIKNRSEISADLNAERVGTLLLPAMRKAGIDCWVIMSREFNKDFVLDYIEDTKAMTGGHRNAYIFFDDGSDKLQRIAVGTHLFLARESRIWDRTVSYHGGEGDKGPSLKPALREIIEELNPQKIGINTSRTIPMCDGLTVAMKKFLVESIGPEYEKRLVSAEGLIVDFLDTRLSSEMEHFKKAAEITRIIHEEVFSHKAIIPGKTKIGEARWYVYDRLAELNLETWFHPIVRVMRKGDVEQSDDLVIKPGDIVHTDIGIIYAGLYTDYQKNAYVLRPGESEPPEGIQKAFQNSLKVQDAILEVSREGKIGYKLKQEAEDLCRKWGIEGRVYSHSTGIPGHGIGAMINPHWPDRYGVRTTYPLRLGAYYAVESSAATEIPEWNGQKITIGTEENAFMTEEGFEFFYPRQEKLYLIDPVE